MKSLFLNIIVFVASLSWASHDLAYYNAVIGGIKSGATVAGDIYNTFKDMTKDVIAAQAKTAFERAIKGGYTIYLEENKRARDVVVPHIIPFLIDVTEAKIRSEDGRVETENATRSAKKFFNGEPEAKTLVRKRKFMRDEFGYVSDPAPGQRKVLEVWYRCLDDKKSIVGNTHHAKAHEMNNIELSCKDVPSIYKKQFGD